MQILNISVDNRPSKQVTSQPYTNLLWDTVHTSFAVRSPSIRLNPDPSDDVSVEFSVQNVYRPVVVRYGSTSLLDELGVSFSVKSPVRVDLVKYSKLTVGVHSVETNFKVLPPKRVVSAGYVKHDVAEALSVGLTVQNIRRF